MKPKHATFLLAAIVCLFLLQRGGLILYGYSHISHPYIDEPVSGVLACDILDGQIRAPLFTYEYLNRSGDVLIEGLLLVPYFKILGRSIFSTKVLALTSALITFLCWLLFIKKYHGMVAVILFGLLYAMPPPIFARLNLIGTISSHHMINPLMALQSILLFKIIEGGQDQKVLRWVWIASGIIAGFGVYTFSTYIIFLGFCFLFFLFFNKQLLRSSTILLFSSSFAAGFSPWIIRALTSPAGGQFLKSLLNKSSFNPWNFVQNFGFVIPPSFGYSFNPWNFVQNFGFVIPHSFGYNYPSRSIGIISVAFAFFILMCTGIILKNCIPHFFKKSSSSGLRIRSIPLPYMHSLFCVLFPLFFFACLSLYSMHITPFEYWPNIGLFATFGVADAIRYRWLHILFPFYFATIAIGTTKFFTICKHKKLWRLTISSVVLFFILCGVWKTATLYSMKDFGKIFLYKGYNYDQFASKFLLGDFASGDIQKSLSVTENYPEEHRGEAYKSFGTLLAEKTIQGTISTQQLDETLKKIPPHYLKDCIYGIVRTAHSSVQKFQVIHNYLIQNYPVIFYESWGSCYLGYKYYGSLVNQQTLFDNIPTTEQWFYKNFIDKFKQETSDVHTSQNALLAEIANAPLTYQYDVVRGLGKLVGSEMLFDTLYKPDYPLDSRLGEKLPEQLTAAFYEGVGAGFAETLCRFWRMQLLPENPDLPLYRKALECEWKRCLVLMSRLPPKKLPEIKKGFQEELHSSYLPEGIRNYINSKLAFYLMQNLI